MSGAEPVLAVYHYEDDHSWQFIGSTDANTDDGIIVALDQVVKLDPSVLEVADLEPGWVARRDDAQSEWVRSKR